MGYFDGLASSVIKKDKNNNAVYYPWGVLGKGYVLPDVGRETAIKKMVILFYQIFFGLFFIYLFLFKNPFVFALIIVALVIWFLVKSHQLTKDCPKSEEKLTLKEGYTNSAKAHNKWILWVLFVTSVLFTLAGLAMLMAGKTGLGLLVAILFGASSTAIGFMLKVKNKV